jgi:hypothetical protein
MFALRRRLAARLALRHLRVMAGCGQGHGRAPAYGERRQEHADSDQDREERAKAHGRRMAGNGSMSNDAPTNGQVDKTGGGLDA